MNDPIRQTTRDMHQKRKPGRIPNPNAKRNEPLSSFRFQPELLARLRAFCKAHQLRPTHTAVVEAALRDYLDRSEPAITDSSANAAPGKVKVASQ